MKLLDEYFAIQEEIYEYFGYQEDWCVIPLDDAREYYWRLEGTGPGCVYFSKSEENVISDEPEYENSIYTNRFLPKWVYRGEEYTMIVVDTHTDGNKFLQVFSNDKERP